MMSAILLELPNENPAATRCGLCGGRAYLVRVFKSSKTHFKVLLCDIVGTDLISSDSKTIEALVVRVHRCRRPLGMETESRSARPVITLPEDGETNRLRPEGCSESAGHDRRFETNVTIDPVNGGDE